MMQDTGFHGLKAEKDNAVLSTPAASMLKTKLTYNFRNHFHPFIGELLEQLNKKSIDGLLDADFHESLVQDFFKDLYQPNVGDKTVAVECSPKEIDVSVDGAYAVYNWELLFHVPLTIAVHLSKNQRFAEAQRWFHYIFDPTTKDGQFWRFLAFRRNLDLGQLQQLVPNVNFPATKDEVLSDLQSNDAPQWVVDQVRNSTKDTFDSADELLQTVQGKQNNVGKQIDGLLRLVSKPDDECTTEELEQKKLVLSGYETLRNNPFQPHAVARTRFLAYQYCVVMKYLDNLIAWGDSLFRQDTIETLNEATQVYVLAANLLGRKPERIPQRGTIRPKTFAQLRANKLDPLGNALVELEGHFPLNLYSPTTEGADTDRTNALFGIGRTLYFCIPRNDKLLGYWDTVADRLFKIRHCMNIEGVVRQLPLFDPPIDPGMLVKAAAAGIDISSLVSGLNQPLAPVRSALLIQKSLEICGEVRGLGGALLSALEKNDAEALGLLRQKHEINIQQLAQDVRFLQWKEAESATESLLKSRDSAVERYRFYRRLLGGKEEDIKDVTEFTLQRRRLTEENFDEVYDELVGQYAQEVTREEYASLEVIDEGTLYLNRNEDAELNVHMPATEFYQAGAFGLRQIAPALSLVPEVLTDIHYWGVGATVGFGDYTENAKTAADILDLLASRETHDAASASKTASYERRADDWMLQSILAARELMQIGRQTISALIREQITYHEYENLKKQIEQAQEIDQFLHDKFTNVELYGWMQGELSKLYYEYYQFAFDIARKAEQTMKHELMRPELDDRSFIKFNYWDGGRKGLLSGETLHLDIKRMEMAYLDNNKREYELTKHVSLRQLDPVALLTLKATGTCEVALPEWLFDLDAPGHYMRRIKNVSLSIPAVTGPYTSVNCTLSLQKSTLRRSPMLPNDEYKRAVNEEDTRFVDYYGTIQSIVTSNAQNDSGMFETNLRDERFLPFEGAGAESTWKLELPAEFRQFDYNTISDVILHVRYTARQGEGPLAQAATEQLRALVKAADTSGLVQLFSLKHDFPSEWHRFVTSTTNDDLKATVKKEYFPYFVQGEDISISKVELHAVQDKEVLSGEPNGLNVANLTKSLKDNKEFEIALAADNVLKREQEAQVFLLFKYTIG
jgi:hypothetical protein